MKELLTKKKYFDKGTIILKVHCSVILQITLPPKTKDLGSTTIMCTIGNLTIGNTIFHGSKNWGFGDQTYKNVFKISGSFNQISLWFYRGCSCESSTNLCFRWTLWWWISKRILKLPLLWEDHSCWQPKSLLIWGKQAHYKRNGWWDPFQCFWCYDSSKWWFELLWSGHGKWGN